MTHPKNLMRILMLAIGFTILIQLSACNESKPPPPEEKKEAPFELKREVYGDPGIFDQPRIQFVWRGPFRDREEIWSIKIDGTDLRLAVDESLLYSGDAKEMEVGRVPVRSPDNRYILIEYMTKKLDFYIIFLVDLKNKTNKFFTRCAIFKAPWAGDSQSFFCQSTNEKNKIERHHLESKKTDIISNHSWNLSRYVQQTAPRIWEITEDGFIVWDFKGNKIREEKLGEISKLYHAINSDGSFLYFRKNGIKKGIIINTKEIKKELLVPRTIDVLLRKKTGEYYRGSFDISKYDPKTKKVIPVYSNIDDNSNYNYENGDRLRKFTLFNEGVE